MNVVKPLKHRNGYQGTSTLKGISTQKGTSTQKGINAA